jgi:hypothetical protein
MADIPDESSPLSPVALRRHREETIAALCEHFARDNLEAEELETLLDHAHQARSLAELDRLLEGLPALRQPGALAGPAAAPLPAEPGSQRDHQLVLAVMGGNVRTGPWTPARNVHVVAFMGGVELDFRQASLAAGVTEVYVLALMGGVEIIVPPGVQVESNGIGIMGGFDHGGQTKFPVDRPAPVLRISGLALMGGVEITERLPGESGKEAKRRLREAGRELRGEERGQF